MSHSDKPKLLADENIPTELLTILSKEGFDIKEVQLGSKDRQVFEFAKLQNRILLTFDKHFLNRIKFPPKESSGIIFLKISPPLIDDIYFSLTKLFNSINSSEFKGKLFILTSTGFKIWPKN